MKREQLEHILRAAGAITDETTILVLGSQSILGSVQSPPPELIQSVEADVFPVGAPEKADLISGSIGEITYFHDTFGYYAHGLPPDACALPAGWDTRLRPLRSEATRGVTGLCLDPVDLACAKLVAGREKDMLFVTALLAHGIVTDNEIITRARMLPKASDQQRLENAMQVVRSRL